MKIIVAKLKNVACNSLVPQLKLKFKIIDIEESIVIHGFYIIVPMEDEDFIFASLRMLTDLKNCYNVDKIIFDCPKDDINEKYNLTEELQKRMTLMENVKSI